MCLEYISMNKKHYNSVGLTNYYLLVDYCVSKLTPSPKMRLEKCGNF